MVTPLSPAQQREVEAWLPYVKVVAASLNVSMSFEDRVQEGAIGAIEAVCTYDPMHGRSMKSHVYGVVRDRIIDAIRREVGRKGYLEPSAVARGRSPVRKPHAKHGVVRVSFDLVEHDQHGPDPFEALIGRCAFDQALAGLRDREVLELHLRDGLTLAEVGARLGFSESRACQRFRRGCVTLARRLGD